MSEEPDIHVREVGTGASRLDAAILFGLVALVVIFFAKTVLLGNSVSKVHVIAEWDSIFKNFTTGKSQLMDPSLILLMVPYYLLVGRMWHSGELPLWNQFSGFGAPLLADPQSLAFSIFHIPLALSPTIQVYNLVLVLELAVLIAGGFVLGRSLGLTRLASVFLGLTLFLCPYEQWYLELLGNGYCLIPFLLASFINAARKKTAGGALVAGLVAGLFVLTAHPELSFCSVSVASAMLIALMPPGMFGRALLLLVLAGITAFCIASPMLLPFLEFLANSDSYKFGNRAPAFYPWQTLAFNFIQPGFGPASPYLGVLATLVFPVGLVTIYDAVRKRYAQASSSADEWVLRCSLVFGISALVTWAVSAKIYPLGLLLTRRPFSYLVVTYFFPVLLVLTAALAAFGVDRVLSLLAHGNRYRHTKIEWSLIAASVISIWTFPLFVDAMHVDLKIANFDMTLPSMVLDKRDWLRNGMIAASLLVLMLSASRRVLTAKRLTLFGCLFVVAGAFSQFAISKGSMPKRPKFDYPQTETITKLKSLGARRMVATGDHTLRPNTNLAYGIRDARMHNPLFPRRFLKFIERSDARLDEFNQVISNSPSPLLDIAGVVHFVTTDVPLDAQVLDSSDRFKLVAETSEGLRIYENRHAVPDAYIVFEAVPVQSAEQALEKLSEPGFSPASQVVVEKQLNQLLFSPSTAEARASAVITERTSTLVEVDTDSTAPGLLVLTDIFYPGWQVTVDGGEREILRANYAFRAVQVPAGKHKVVFQYRPVVFYVGGILFAASAIGLLAYLLITGARNKAIR